MKDPYVTLLEIQDLRSKRRELETETELEELEQEHFNIDPQEAIRQLDERIASLEDELDDPIRRRYDRVKRSVDRVVVPVINGVCYGCFVSIATAAAGEQDPNKTLHACENCGRFLYIIV